MVEDYGEVEKFLCGSGLTQIQARKTTFREVECRIDWEEKRKAHDWEVMRWGIFNMYILSPDLKRGDKPKKPQDLFKLPNERETRKVERVEISESDLKALKEIGLWD